VRGGGADREGERVDSTAESRFLVPTADAEIARQTEIVSHTSDEVDSEADRESESA